MKAILSWLAGRKTYLVAVALVLGTLILVFMGRLTPATASEVALFALPVFAATFRSALSRHQQQELQILTEIAAAGIAYRKNQTSTAIASLAAAASDGIKLGTELAAESQSAAAGVSEAQKA